jgi:hypothetical protein
MIIKKDKNGLSLSSEADVQVVDENSSPDNRNCIITNEKLSNGVVRSSRPI